MGRPLNLNNLTTITGEEQIDVREMLARQKTHTLWTNYRLDTKNEELKPLIENIKKYNDLLLMFKGAERYLSKDGKAYLCWDIFEKGQVGNEEKYVQLFFAQQNPRNQTMRLFQQKEYAGVCVIEPTRNDNGIYMSYLQMRTKTETKTLMLSQNATNKVPMDVFYFDTPPFLKFWMLNNNKTYKHNYGVLPMKEILNINIIDYGKSSENVLCDDYPVAHLREVINGLLVFYKKEMNKNQTKLVGTFGSFQDFYKEHPKAAQYVYAANKLANGGQINREIAQRYSDAINPHYTKNILEEDYILSLSHNSPMVEIMQSTFDGEMIARAITSMLEVYFNGSGYDYAVQSMSGQSQYVSTSEIQTQNRRTTESIKSAIVLRSAQYKEVFENIIDAWFGEVGYHKKFDGEWDFKVVSNLVNEEMYSIDKIVMMKDNGLISNALAIEKANKDLSEKDLEELIKQIERDQEKEFEKQKQEAMLGMKDKGSNGEQKNK